VRGGERVLEDLGRIRLGEDGGVHLEGAAPVGDGVEVVGQRRVLEGHGLLVQRVGGEREGVVGGGAAAEDEERVAGVLAEVGVGGDGGGAGGEGAEEGEVVGGGRAAAAAEQQAGEEEVPHRSAARCGGDGESEVVSGLAAPAAATAADRDGVSRKE
jgi:hypothetical protein